MGLGRHSSVLVDIYLDGLCWAKIVRNVAVLACADAEGFCLTRFFIPFHQDRLEALLFLLAGIYVVPHLRN